MRAACGADMLVVGSRGNGGFSGALLGSVSQYCVHHALCPVLSWSSEGPAGVGNDQHRRQFQDMRNQRTGSEHAGLPPV